MWSLAREIESRSAQATAVAIAAPGVAASEIVTETIRAAAEQFKAAWAALSGLLED